MRIDGVIIPNDDNPFNKEIWICVLDSRPEFRRACSRTSRHPLNRTAMTIHAAPDPAGIWLHDELIGNVSWSHSEQPLINVSIEPAGLPLVQEWAAVLGGQWRVGG